MRRINLRSLIISLIGTFVIVGWLFLVYNFETYKTVISEQPNLIRFHVLANSDSVKDQAVKLKVRDAIVSYLTPYLKDVSDATVARQIIMEQHDCLIHIAQQVLIANGANYSVQIEHGIFEFPIKTYGNLTLPAGKYEAVRVLLGNAEGKNWWCVLFPPLCFIDVTNAAAIPAGNSIGKESNQTDGIEFKWKIAEIWSEAVSK